MVQEEEAFTKSKDTFQGLYCGQSNTMSISLCTLVQVLTALKESSTQEVHFPFS